MGELTIYEHHGRPVVVDKELKGTHRQHCLCFRCANFRPGTIDNCLIAQAVFANCVKFDLVTPVYECPDFVPTDPVDAPRTSSNECQDCRARMGGPHKPECRYHSATRRFSSTTFGQLENPERNQDGEVD